MSDKIKSQSEYLKSYSRCMVCDSEDIEGGPVEIDCGIAVQEVSCNNCNATWEDVYALSGYKNLEVSSED